MKRPGLWVPLGVNVATGKTGTALLERFGVEGIAVWTCYLAACKRSSAQGRIAYCGEAEGWDLLGLAKHRPSFTLKEFFDVTGRLKQTRRSRVGRVEETICTHWGDWSEDVSRQEARERKQRERKRRSEPTSGRDTKRDAKRDSRARRERGREKREEQAVSEGPKPREALLPAELEHDLVELGWDAEQRQAAKANVDLALACAKEARKLDDWGEIEDTPGGWAWGVFLSGEAPRERKAPKGTTGYRFVRGTGSGTYVRDPEGRDQLPPGYVVPEQNGTSKRTRTEPEEEEAEPLSPEGALARLQALKQRVAAGPPADDDIPIGDAAEDEAITE